MVPILFVPSIATSVILLAFVQNYLLAAGAIVTTQCSSLIRNPLEARSEEQCLLGNGKDCARGALQWSHEPICKDLSRGNKDADMVCLYTSSTFGSGRGISFITRPEIAAEVAAKYVLEDSRSIHPLPPFHAQETKDRGIGLFSNRTIERGEIVLSRPPSLVMLRDGIAQLSLQEQGFLQRRALSQLPQDTQKLILDLAKSRGGDEIDDIVQTNSMRLSYGQHGVHMAVIPEAARVNHDCRPNSYYRFNETTSTLEVFALRNIEPNEELTFSYGFSELPHAPRQHHLQSNWGFTCTCTLCAADEATKAESDARLINIRDTKQVISTSAGNMVELLHSTMALLGLYDQEGLIVPKADYFEIGAYALSQMGNEEGVKKWAKMAREAWAVIAGSESWEVKRMAELEQNPKEHGSWGGNNGA